MDGEIISPPHTILALGIIAINLGALLMVLPLQNRASDPAERRKLARDHTHMVPPDFPLLLVVPALALDRTLRRFGERSDWLLAPALGGAFFAIFLVVQWPFSFFLRSEWSMNDLFVTGNYAYFTWPGSSWVSRRFARMEASAETFRNGLLVAALVSVASARVGLWLGGWMSRVKR